MEKSRIAIVPAGNPKNEDVMERVLEAINLYRSGYVDSIFVSGKEKDAEGLAEIILTTGNVPRNDVSTEIFSKDMYDTLDMFADIYSPDKVDMVCYISEEKRRQEFEKNALRFLNDFNYEFHPVRSAKPVSK